MIRLNINPMAIPGITRVTIEDIASRIWGIEKELLFSKSRKREVVECRQVLINFRNTVLKEKQAKSASYYNKGHNSTIYANSQVECFLQYNSLFKRKYQMFLKKVTDNQDLLNLKANGSNS
jgi:chromosomal replication initiation ATPase DnaA